VTALGSLAAAVAILTASRLPAEAPPTAARFASVAAALDAALGAGGATPGAAAAPPPAPIVVGFGELHQQLRTAAIPSALRRFTGEILPLLAPRASDLVVETWVASGRCGEAEARVVEGVAETTERPAATEDEIVALLRRGKEAGVRPHILRVSCADYRALLSSSSGKTVDFARMLALTRRELEAAIDGVLVDRPRADAAKMIVVYGGALHNDLHPDPALAPFSYGGAVFRATGGRYREIDLYVPEYLAGNAAMRAEAWYPVWERSEREGRPGELTVIRRSEASAIIVFPRAAQR
jgi:hypothetical protein